MPRSQGTCGQQRIDGPLEHRKHAHAFGVGNKGFTSPGFSSVIQAAKCFWGDRKGDDEMPGNAEIAKDTEEYLSLKALLNVIGVNLIDIDRIKE